jgi:hypothetical protein
MTSYPPNSENASPSGTFSVYLSCLARVIPPKTAIDAATIGAHRDGLSSHIKSPLRSHLDDAVVPSGSRERLLAHYRGLDVDPGNSGNWEISPIPINPAA